MKAKNKFEVGVKYSASQNLSRLALENGIKPTYFDSIIYVKSKIDMDTIEHEFKNKEGVKIYLDDNFINNGKTEDNSLIVAKLKNQ